MPKEKPFDYESISYRVKNVKVEDYFKPEFLEAMRSILPNSVIGHITIDIPDAKEYVYVGHDTRGGKLDMNRVDVTGLDPKYTNSVLELVKKVYDK